LIGIWFSFVVLRGFLPRPRRKWGESTRIIIFFRTCLHRCTMANSDTIFRIRSQFSPSVRGCWIYSEPDCHSGVAISQCKTKSLISQFPSGPHQKNLVVSNQHDLGNGAWFFSVAWRKVASLQACAPHSFLRTSFHQWVRAPPPRRGPPPCWRRRRP
jgi:hypothetical protein